MHSVELTLDDDTDRRIRTEWATLADAGLPSQARHTGESNRPHITLALSETLSADVAARLATAVADLPIPVPVGGNVKVTFTATDDAGLRSSRSRTFTFDPCPG